MTVDVVLLPAHLVEGSLAGKSVVVFDVLRATTSITAALAVGVRSIRAFASLDDALAAANKVNPRPLLCGEAHTVAPPGFDLGNSPRQFTTAHAGRDVYLATTNGTKALAASRSAAALFCGALVNAGLAARAVASRGNDIVLLGSGTDGRISLEDTLGAGAVCNALVQNGAATLASDMAIIARRLFLEARKDLPGALRDGQGGHNVIKAGLEPDIDFAARLDVIDVVGEVDTADLVIKPWHA
ncbi:MAG: 2-phosphosulfolactate phosphatase [Planctomycetota bacterium]|nr:2-phosphosulfolactate phosphatase [Planctomycetota bacterium]